MPAQSAILPLPSAHARFIVFQLHQLTLDELKAQLQHLLDTQARLITQYPEQHIKLSIAFGPALWAQLHDSAPAGLHPLQPINNAAFDLPAVPADVLIHIASERADLCFSLAQTAMQHISDKVKLIDEKSCFRFLDSRDLTGFIDGTENPQLTQDRMDTALLSDEHGIFAEGSFVFAQRFIHDLDKWNRLRTNAQEDVFGRSKLDSVEMSDDVKPKNAHIARVVIEEDGEELEIVRHSLPYGDGSGDQGLFFIAYTNNLSIIDKMLAYMFGSAGDGLHDRLLHFTTPVNGAYYFAPSQQLLEEVIAAE